MRSRSELAVISRPPSLPSARIAVCWPRMRPYLAAKSSSTLRCTARMRTSASRANTSPACSADPQTPRPGGRARHRAEEYSRADQDHVLLAEQADGVEHVFVAGRFGQPAREPSLELRFVGQRAEEARLDQRIDQIRAL